jgi:predicted negative regulator of RcsB-dependent stress response
VGRLRQARLLWSLGRADEALALLQVKRMGSFASLYAELRGDILLGQARAEEARQAYSAALAAEPSTEQRAGLELKLNDLNTGVAPATPKGG